MITFDADRQRLGLKAVFRTLVEIFLGIVLLTTLAAPACAQQTPVDGASCGPAQSCAPTTSTAANCTLAQQAVGTCRSPTTCTPAQLAVGTCTPPGNGDGGTCSPAPGGNPSCSATASPGITPGGSGGDVSVGGGNPINLVNGNKYQLETDLAPLPGVLGLELKRHYNSLSAHAGLMGAGWRMSYEVVLYDLGNQVQILQADGQRLTFQRGIGEHAALCTAARPQDGQVRIERDAHGEPTYVWRWPDGRTLTFSNGRHGGFPLQAIVAPGGERLTLTYAPAGELVQVRDPQGRRLIFIYDTHGVLKAIDTPLGQVRYTFDARGRLTEAASLAPGQTEPYRSRLYHYEDHYNGGHVAALTGISLRGLDPTTHQPVTQRLSTYAYDARGLAILTTKGSPLEMKDGKPVAGTGIEQLRVAYVDKALPIEGRPDKAGEVHPKQLGKTVITNSLGATSTLTTTVIGGRYRLVSFIGPGCSTCGPGNMRYAYNAAGQLLRAIHLDDRGQPASAEVYVYDAYGRTVREGSQGYAQSTPQPPAWKKRYEYADLRYRDGSVAMAPQASLIAEPSVIAGQEHVLRFTYDEGWEVTRVTESGSSPIDDQGLPSVQGTPILRTTTFRYANVGGRSLLVEIDGPLANGPTNSPVDSDVTRIEYDSASNSIASIVSPMNQRRSFTRDEVGGRLSRETSPDGIVTAYTYDADGRVSTIDHAGQVVRRVYGADGQVSRISDAAGRAITLTHDVAGRLVQVADAQGYRGAQVLDTEDATLVNQLYEPGQDQPLRATYRWYDDRHRLKQLLRPDGRIDQWRYDEQGRMTEHLDGDDVLHRVGYSERAGPVGIDLTTDGLVRMRFSATRRDETTAGQPAAVQDDFGRTVAQFLPDQGTRWRRYDMADHLLAEQRRDQAGQLASTLRLRYDAAGRTVQRAVFDDNGKPVQTVDLRYEGAYLREENDDAESRLFEHDAAGRLSKTVIELKDEQGRKVFSTTLATAFDPATGQPITQLLADGSTLHITHQNAARTANAIYLQSRFWTAFGNRLSQVLPDRASRLVAGWVPRTVVVTDAAFHPFNGITSYGQGNGIVTARGFDIAGRLQSLKVAGTTTLTNQTLGHTAGPRIRTLDDQADAVDTAHYAYDGFGTLEPAQGPRLIRTSSSPDTLRPERDSLGRAIADARYRYTYTTQGQVASVSTLADKDVAHYRYNAQGQRMSKTLASGETVYFLWHGGKLVAEVAGTGAHRAEVTAQYLYFGSEGRTAPVAKLESAHAEGNRTACGRILYVHTGHRGEPLFMTDGAQQVVWHSRPDVWGYVEPTSLRSGSAVMNLRLPGQYFDGETGLHDNWHRSYDARPESALRGTYLSPDPLGLPNGPDAYAYVNGDPVNRIDPTGLYESDVHYYMTFFLALVSGMDYDTAMTVALADQYVDVNTLTKPVTNVPLTNYPNPFSATWNQEQLLDYHFVLSDHDTGKTGAQYKDNTDPNVVINSPSNQLNNLTNAASSAPTDCAKNQFFGEYLHAFEDTFSHRNKTNNPYDALDWAGLGVGHGLADGFQPDYTYDDPAKGWTVRESRTLDMELATLDKMTAFKGTTAVSGGMDLVGTLTQFNQTRENEEGGGLGAKLGLLTSALASLNIKDSSGNAIDLTVKQRFNKEDAALNRDKNLCDASDQRLEQSKYPGTMLPTEACAK